MKERRKKAIVRKEILEIIHRNSSSSSRSRSSSPKR